MRWSCLSRLLVLRAAVQKCLRRSQRPTLGLGGGKMLNGPNRRPRHYKNRNGRNERPVDGIKASSSVWREDSNELVLHGHFIVGALEDFSQNARSEEHTSELQSHSDLVCRLLLEKKK